MVDYLGSSDGPGAYGAENTDAAKPGASADVYEYKIEMPNQQAASSLTKQTSKVGQDQGNLWESILADVVKRDEQEDSYLLLMGQQGAGKRSIVREINNKYVNSRNKSMQVDKMGSDYAALDFSFLYVKDLLDTEMASASVTTDDNLPKLNIWSVNDSERCELIESVLTPASLPRTAAVICLDFEEPMEIMNHLRTWISALSKTIFNLVPQMEVGAHE